MMTQFEEKIVIRDKAIPFTGRISEITDFFHQNRFKECALKEIQEKALSEQNNQDQNIIKISADIKIYKSGMGEEKGAVEYLVITWSDGTTLQIPNFAFTVSSLKPQPYN